MPDAGDTSQVDVGAAFHGVVGSFRDLVDNEAVGGMWLGPSALAGYTVAGLVGHTLSGVSAVERYLDGGPGNGAPVAKATYYASVPSPAAAPDLHAEIRSRGAGLGELGQQAVVEELDAVRQRLHARLLREPATRTVTVMGGTTMSLHDYLETRVVEVVVHSDDLAASVGVECRLPADALSIAVEHLLGVARQRHGDLAVVRALTRRERDTVEALRVF